MSAPELPVADEGDDDERRFSLRAFLLWLGALGALTIAMLTVRDSLDKAHVALGYLLVVLGAGASTGRRIGVALSVAAFVLFNFFFLPPYHSLFVARALDWLVLAAFLVTGIVAAQLLARARADAALARQRSAEVDRLSAVGAEALNAGRAEEALTAIAEVMRKTLHVARCEIFVPGHAEPVALVASAGTLAAPSEPVDTSGPYALAMGGVQLLEWVLGSGRAALERMDGGVRVSAEEDSAHSVLGLDVANARALLLPLRVRDRTVGVLRLTHDDALSLETAQMRFLVALSYYAALGVERLRLEGEAEHAQALREADELKNAVLASVSHDLRTPLTTIKALAHDLRMEGHERAATIEEEADRLNRFVADLLDLSRLNAGSFDVTPEMNAVEDLVGAAIQRASGKLRGHELRVALDTAEPLLVGRFDFVQSLRVLVNLLENAVKYSPSGSTIELTAERVGDEIRLTVADRGVGVRAGEEERIFEPFYRPRGQPDTGGAGLGLSIARRMAEAQGGRVSYAPRDGGGSLFVLSLPAASIDGAPTEGTRAASL
ncbi:MAG TPA: ATP-binding protein [Gemmatimonadaceae bacterium]|nr:ATP-binding protein [Gemmatimonadaceae bacterium]